MRRRLERIYREHRQGLYSLALSITRAADLAEDSVQEALARLWRSARQPRGDAVAYVFAAVRNAALEIGWKQRPRSGVPASLFDAAPADPAKMALMDEQERLVRAAVDGLPIRQRQAVVLRVYAGLSFQQIADTLGEPLATVASRYRRALERIRSTVETLK